MNILPTVSVNLAPPSGERIQLLADPRSTPHLLIRLIERSGLSQSEVARRLGVQLNSVRQYYKVSRPKNPGLVWFVRFVEALGGRVIVEFPN